MKTISYSCFDNAKLAHYAKTNLTPKGGIHTIFTDSNA